MTRRLGHLKKHPWALFSVRQGWLQLENVSMANDSVLYYIARCDFSKVRSETC